MKNLFITCAVLSFLSATSQTTSDFENLSLTPSSVWNATNGSEQGFSDGNVYFPSFWDTSFGGFWAGGFAYSNQTDSTTSGYLNPFSAKIASGFNGSANYAVNNGDHYFKLTGAASGKQLNGAYITNTTYAYNSMRDGDTFSQKFGGESGNDPDYFNVNFIGYNQGSQSGDTVTFYLADYRNSDNSQDYLVKEWVWIDFSSLGNVDSVAFYFISSDYGKGGMNTPAYFCLDNISTADSPQSVLSINTTKESNLFPNPAYESVSIKSTPETQTIRIIDIQGRIVRSFQPNSSISSVPLQELSNGIYTVQRLSNTGIFVEKLIIAKP